MKVLLFFIALSTTNIFSQRLIEDLEIETEVKKARQFYYNKALTIMNKIIELEPNNMSHYTLRVGLYNNLGFLNQEVADLTKIISLRKNKSATTANTHRALALLKLGRFMEALSDINYVIQNSNEENTINESYVRKASILYQLDSIEKSIYFYELALKKNNSSNINITSQSLIGLSNITTDENKALKLLNKSILINKNDDVAYINRSNIYINNSKFSEALKDLETALLVNPTNEDIYLNLGEYYLFYTDKLNLAKYYYEYFLKLAPQSNNANIAIMNLGVINHKLGFLEEALKYFEKLDNIHFLNDEFLYNYSLLCLDLKKTNKALTNINRAIKINDQDAEYFKLKRKILNNLNNSLF